MSWVWIEPSWGDALRQQGLLLAEDFLRLPGVILGGHPDRHVMHVELDGPTGRLPCFLKKEHRVRWRDRLASWWDGWGWVTKSAREGRVLQQAGLAGIRCPKVVAYGEARGQAFLLTSALAEAQDLRVALLQANPTARRQWTVAVGAALARLHQSFVHGELFSKHILAQPNLSLAFVDWQQARPVRNPRWSWRCRDLAAVNATLADNLASPGDRLRALRAYCRIAHCKTPLRQLAKRIDAMSARLLQKRRVREMRQPPLPFLEQNLIWLDGEALCVTRQFWQETKGTLPACLDMPADTPAACPWQEDSIVYYGGRACRLTRRWFRPKRRQNRKNPFPAPEFEQAGMLVRLRRFGLEGPRLLALGHRDLMDGRKFSFMLTELPEAAPLHAPPQPGDAAHAAVMARVQSFHERLSAAGYALSCSPWGSRPLWARSRRGDLVLWRLDGLERSDRPRPSVGRHGTPERQVA